MPRGVYPRKPRQSSSTPKTPATSGKRRGRKPKAAVATSVAAPKKLGRPRKNPVTSSSLGSTGPSTPNFQLNAIDSFQIVRDNIVALSQVHANVKASNEASQTVDTEMAQQLQLMGSLRAKYFGGQAMDGGVSHEVTSPTLAGNENGTRSTVPLPPPPAIPVPQPPRQSV